MVPQQSHNAMSKLDTIITLLKINDKLDKIMAVLDQLTSDVADVTSVDQSVIVLLTGLTAQIKAAGIDQAKLTDLTNSLEAQTSALKNAVLTNTTAGTPPASGGGSTPTTGGGTTTT